MLSRFPNSTLKIGAKVSLSPDSEWAESRRRTGASNPIGVQGFVLRKSCGYVHVKWGIDSLEGHDPESTDNWYRNGDYDLIAEGEPGYLATE